MPPPPVPPGPNASQKWLWVGALSGGTVLLALLFFFAPGQYPFYPRCLFHSLTGWQCPGCGGLRAMHQLLHGNIARAFALNPLFILSLPFLGGLLAWQLVRRAAGHPPSNLLHRPLLLWLGLIVLIGFMVARNLVPLGLH